MKALGEAAIDLPWLAPGITSLAALARPVSVWNQISSDPGCVLLLVRSQCPDSNPLSTTHRALALETALRIINSESPCVGQIDWNLPGIDSLYLQAQRQARLAAELAGCVPGCDLQKAWIASLLAPLGWFALASISPGRIPEFLNSAQNSGQIPSWQQTSWGLDYTAIARRLARWWRLPGWLNPILSHLGLNVEIAEPLGADAKLFQVVQLSVALIQRFHPNRTLTVGTGIEELLFRLGLDSDEVFTRAQTVCNQPLEIPKTEPLQAAPLLKELLELGSLVASPKETTWTDRLEQEVDQLHRALEIQCSSEKDRLQEKKLTSLAELAAGAGHEINNPLAIISGQAQYLTRQLQNWADQSAENPALSEMIQDWQTHLNQGLLKIIGQTHRVHSVLTDLMQYARPGIPRFQILGIQTLAEEAVRSLDILAQTKEVRLELAETGENYPVRIDPGQMRTTLSALIRNGIEAAPREGWVQIRIQKTETGIEIIVADNGPGPAPEGSDHLFDPFYSGRSAGRGRGLGLPTAWRLIGLQNGSIRYERSEGEETRFVLTLPIAQSETVPQNSSNPLMYVT